MKFIFSTVIVLVCAACVSSRAIFKVTLLRYEANEDKCCDGVKFFGTCNDCDPYLTVCLRQKDTGKESCTKTSRENNKRSIDLKSSGISPTTFQLFVDTLAKPLSINIKTKDYDAAGSDDDMDTLNYELLANHSRTPLRVTLNGEVQKYNTRITAKISIICQQDYYGPDCDTFCVNNSHSICYEDGTRVCLDGFTGSRCETVLQIIPHNVSEINVAALNGVTELSSSPAEVTTEHVQHTTTVTEKVTTNHPDTQQNTLSLLTTNNIDSGSTRLAGHSNISPITSTQIGTQDRTITDEIASLSTVFDASISTVTKDVTEFTTIVHNIRTADLTSTVNDSFPHTDELTTSEDVHSTVIPTSQTNSILNNTPDNTTTSSPLRSSTNSQSAVTHRGTTPATLCTQTTPGNELSDAISANCNEFGWDIKVNMDILRCSYPDIKSSDIYLGKNLCHGERSGSILTFTQGLRDCLTSEIISGSQLIYNNELIYAVPDPDHPFIIRHYNWTVGVECDVYRNETTNGHILHDGAGNTSAQVAGETHYAVNMSFFKDSGYMTEIPGNPLHVRVGTLIYVKVFSPGPEWTVKMVVKDCYTQTSSNSTDSSRFYLIQNGCEKDKNTHIISRAGHEIKFEFQDFQYTSGQEGLYLFCDAVFCSVTDHSPRCLQTCQGKKKRSTAEDADDFEVETVMRHIVHSA